MPSPVPLILHERRDTWGRHLRPRAESLSVRLVETRSCPDLLRAVAGTAVPVVLLALDRRVAEGLRHLDQVFQLAPDALVVVLDPTGEPSVRRLASELGAVMVLPAEIRPPLLFDLLGRWLPLAATRAAAAGWVEGVDHPADSLDALLNSAL